MYTGLFNLYEEMGREDDAIRCVELMKKYADGDEFILRQYHYCLGNAYSHKGDYEKAIEFYKKAEEEECPVILYGNMAICYYSLGRYEEAKELFQKNMDKSGQLRLIYFFLIQHCNFFLNGNTDEEVTQIIEEQAKMKLVSSPDNRKEWLFHFAEAAASRGEFEKAQALLKEAYAEKMCPGCGQCHELLWGEAWVYIYQGMYKEAADCLEKARECEMNETTMNADYLKVCKMMKEDHL